MGSVRFPASPGKPSPDPDAVLRVEPETVAGPDVERLDELVEVAHDVGAELGGAVRVDGDQLEHLLLAALGAPHVREVEEHPLLAGEPVHHRGLLALEADQVRLQGYRDAAEVADVLADRE